jgi:hypothetical protein
VPDRPDRYGNGTADEDLPEDLRELVASVQAKAREAPGVSEVRALAAEKERQAQGSPVTLTQVRALADIAVRRAERVATLTIRLAELTGGGRAGA